MSINNTSSIQAVCGLTDDYLDYLDTVNSEEMHAEYQEVFGAVSGNRINHLKEFFYKQISKKKKEIASRLLVEDRSDKFDSNVVNSIKMRYGSLKEFFRVGFLDNPDMPTEMTLQYRNIKEVTDEDIELLIEALFEHGNIKIDDDKS